MVLSFLSVGRQYPLQKKIHEKTPTSPLWPWWNGPPTHADAQYQDEAFQELDHWHRKVLLQGKHLTIAVRKHSGLKSV